MDCCRGGVGGYVRGGFVGVLGGGGGVGRGGVRSGLERGVGWGGFETEGFGVNPLSSKGAKAGKSPKIKRPRHGKTWRIENRQRVQTAPVGQSKWELRRTGEDDSWDDRNLGAGKLDLLKP